MPPLWDPKESDGIVYDRVHRHSKGMVSFTLVPLFEEDQNGSREDAELRQKLHELEVTLKSASPKPNPSG